MRLWLMSTRLSPCLGQVFALRLLPPEPKFPELEAPHVQVRKDVLLASQQEMTAPHFNRSFEFRKVRATSL